MIIASICQMQAKPEQCDFLYPDICITSRPPDLGCSYFRQKLSVVPRIHIDLIVREWLGRESKLLQKKRKVF